ncbi:defensin Ec-AMP-D1-like [Primulina huaijiensis]|uniref:defensin Ec-AMP-D1-like n=1 Tax=Primulina huaijiensis TaxID=1492673 RepID=UPI003CC6E5BC
MERFADVFLVFVLAMLMGIGPMVGEARFCESQSLRFKGPCVSDTNCASVCHTEGFPGGDCRGFRRRCFCTKPC